MARGGKREGAGRRKGSVNRVTAAEREANAASGETPLQYLLRVMRDPATDEKRRDTMAIAAAPYQHAKLASVAHTGPGGAGPVEHDVEVHIVDHRAPDHKG